MRIGYDHRQSHRLQALEVVDVVADEGDFPKRDPEFLDNSKQYRQFVLAAVEAPHRQLLASMLYHGVGLSRNNDCSNPEAFEFMEPEPIATPASNGLQAVFGYVHRIVSEDAVEIERNEANAS
jgi:hypothetical protein